MKKGITMETNNLRIGDYVNIEGDIVKVKEIYGKSIHYDYGEYESYATEDFIQPIELTEELLVNIGFSLTDKDYPCFEILYNNTFMRYIQKFNLLYLENLVSEEEGLHSEIKLYGVKYLHQLQNAYHLLTNDELEIKL
jgi:hypothetical protein